jgi:ATP-dependent Clp protease adapter protein ClpS
MVLYLAERETKTEKKAKRPDQYQVELSFNISSGFLVLTGCHLIVLMKVFKKTQEEAERHYEETILKGQSAVLVTTEEVAQEKCTQALDEVCAHADHNPFIISTLFRVRRAP